MGSIVREHETRTVWFQKTWDLAQGYGYHIQIYHKKYCKILKRYTQDWIGYGFSKNKFTAFRKAMKQHGK